MKHFSPGRIQNANNQQLKPYDKACAIENKIARETGAIVSVKLEKGGGVTVTANSFVDWVLSRSVITKEFHYSKEQVLRTETPTPQMPIASGDR